MKPIKKQGADISSGKYTIELKDTELYYFINKIFFSLVHNQLKTI